MKHIPITLVIILSALFINPWTIGDDAVYDFTFVRLKYNGSFRYKSLWDIDYPAADRNLLFQLNKQTNINANPDLKVIPVGSPELYDYPFAYIAELSRLNLSKKEAANLREYLLRGGFIMTDDFHGTEQWRRFYKQYKKIFPKREPRDIPMDASRSFRLFL